ncbi:MlaA family lipoprotein [Solimonas marina]|uniref:VacJ family lipoprotein n=1 Tax=Solimonas marina TaxID=2714601 RepID=A0A970BAZ8_9GAMM|nr:VacJ family lipoprotein [Solimonas marina]NKF23886.1 VacJ family lipoprotein [Solimonas marina]
MKFGKLPPTIAASLMLAVLAGCAHNSPYEPSDPLEPMNRKIYAFNMVADKYVLRPVTVTYVDYTPKPVRTGLSNFFDNLFYPSVIINDALQAKFKQSGLDLTRFLMNTTFGLAGLLDPASMVGLQKHDEDLGQTLGKWGVGEGWYIMLPFFGPSTNRDLVGRVGDNWTEPLQYTDLTIPERVGIAAVQAVDTRSQLLDFDSILQQQLDPYVFLRTAYLQRRLNQVYDGNPPEKLMEPELPDE